MASSSALRLPRSPHLWGMLIVLIGVIFAFLAADPRHPDEALKPIAHFISKPMHDGFLILGIGGLLLLAYLQKNRALAIRTFTVMLTETALFGIAKGITWFGFHILARPSNGDGGFPSGHTAASVALAWLLSEKFGARWSPFFYVIAAAVGWSRVADGAHYAYQVLAGAILGFGVAWTLSGRFVEPEPEAATAAAATD
jgi:membrane-associated phospholipid phosphatase